MKTAICTLILAVFFCQSANAQQKEVPHPSLAALGVLVGEWKLEGHMAPSTEIKGSIIYEWLPGGYFLVQRGDLQFGRLLIQGLEIVGYDAEQKALVSHGFGNLGSHVGSYRWEFADGLLKITSGEMRFEGTLSADKATFSAAGSGPKKA